MKKSKVVLIITIVILSLILIGGGVGAYFYFTTDFLKSDQQLFFKYMAENGELLEALSDEGEQRALKRIIQDKYKIDTEAKFNLESNDEQIANEIMPIRNFKIQSTAKSDPINKKDSENTVLKYLDKELFVLKYLRNGDIYAITSDEVINKYLAFENNNLKELAAKYGITDTTAIPDKIESVDLEKLFFVDETLQKEIADRYSKVIYNQFSKNDFSRQKNVQIVVDNQNIVANAYTLKLTEKNVMNVLTSVLTTLMEDENTLNLIIEKVNILNENVTVNIPYIKLILQSLIEQLNKIEVTDNEALRITVYESNGKLVRTEFGIEENKVILDIQKNNTQQKAIITFDIQNDIYNEVILEKIEIITEKLDGQNSVIMVLSLEVEGQTVKVSVQSKTNYGDTVQNNTLLNVNVADIAYISAEFSMTVASDNTVQIEDLTSENSVLINNLSPEYMQNLLKQIGERLESLFNKKLEEIATANANLPLTETLLNGTN